MIRLADIPKPPCSPPVTFWFERWLGRPMSARQRAVVTLLEHQRARQRRAAYLLVNDPYNYKDVKQIIVDYLRWYTTQVAPQFRPVLVTKSRKDQELLLPYNDRLFIRRTSRSFTALRGQTHHAIALLNADEWLTRRRPDGCCEAIAQFAPMVSRENPHDILIIHGNSRTRRLTSTFAAMWRRNISSPHYLTLDVTTLTCNLDVGKPIRSRSASNVGTLGPSVRPPTQNAVAKTASQNASQTASKTPAQTRQLKFLIHAVAVSAA